MKVEVNFESLKIGTRFTYQGETYLKLTQAFINWNADRLIVFSFNGVRESDWGYVSFNKYDMVSVEDDIPKENTEEMDFKMAIEKLESGYAIKVKTWMEGSYWYYDHEEATIMIHSVITGDDRPIEIKSTKFFMYCLTACWVVTDYEYSGGNVK